MVDIAESMVERVAAAIAQRRFERGGGHNVSGKMPPDNGDRDDARAALKAMREPTEEIEREMTALAVNGNANWRDYYAAIFESALR